VKTIDGVLAKTPMGDNTVDASILSNGSFGWEPEKELKELERITKPNGIVWIILKRGESGISGEDSTQ
jgi:ubiquinone/menaquinone biosynthesis C-methylase UbiE